MKKRKGLIISLLSGALLAVSLSSGLSLNNAQEKANSEEGTVLVKDSNNILTVSQWLDKSLREIGEIKPGMKRSDLRMLFSPDGGISSRTHNRYVFRKYAIKIDVEFEVAGNAERDAQGRLLGEESDDDVIKKISKPYLEYPAQD